MRGGSFCVAAQNAENELRNTHYGNLICQKFSNKTEDKIRSYVLSVCHGIQKNFVSLHTMNFSSA